MFLDKSFTCLYTPLLFRPFYVRNDPPNFNRASNGPEICGKSTGMDIDKFTDTPSPNLSFTIKVNRDNVAGGYESTNLSMFNTYLVLCIQLLTFFWGLVVAFVFSGPYKALHHNSAVSLSTILIANKTGTSGQLHPINLARDSRQQEVKML